MTRRKRNVIAIVSGVLLAGAGFAVWFGYQVVQVPRDAYAVWWTADLVIEHMEKNGGFWPRNWEELKQTSDEAHKGTVSTNRDGTMIAEFRPRDTVDELKRRVEIDWQADPQVLANAQFKETGPPFRVIWLRNGRSSHYQGKEPNEMVLDYLKSKTIAVNEAAAAEKGDAAAQYRVAVRFVNGDGVPKDPAEAFRWCSKSAEQGYPPAQEGLGIMYVNGLGVASNEVEAAKWYRKAADNGLAAAQCKVGDGYANGLGGLAQDYFKAVEWYRMAAEQGDAGAQNKLGARYEQGQGVAKDPASAVAWYRKAAEQGFTAAQINLGRCYATGHGVPRDVVQAYAWMELAKQRSEQKVTEDQARLAAEMSKEQIAEALRVSNAFRTLKIK